MGRASDWLREERRKVLGDWAAFCLACGHVVRWFEEFERELPSACPACGGELRHRCPACAAPISSAFAVECEDCAAPLRPGELLGIPIRRSLHEPGPRGAEREAAAEGGAGEPSGFPRGRSPEAAGPVQGGRQGDAVPP